MRSVPKFSKLEELMAASQNRLWVTWENQRRSKELARKLGCELSISEFKGPGRYPRSITKTISALLSRRPDVVFVQNPSMVATFIVCLYGHITKVPVVVDRHSTFFLDWDHKGTLEKIVWRIMHKTTIKCADLTIVTNQFLGDVVSELGGRPFVLPDMIPDLKKAREISLKGKQNVLLISSFGVDEPIEEVMKAMRTLEGEDLCLYISGHTNRVNKETLEGKPSNTEFTGFLEEQDFIDMLYSVDAVMALTTEEYCMLCGCYEAISAGRPLVTSNKKVLREYFTDAVFVENHAESIATGLKRVLSESTSYTEKTLRMRDSLRRSWEESYHRLEKAICTLKARG